MGSNNLLFISKEKAMELVEDSPINRFIIKIINMKADTEDEHQIEKSEALLLIKSAAMVEYTSAGLIGCLSLYNRFVNKEKINPNYIKTILIPQKM